MYVRQALYLAIAGLYNRPSQKRERTPIPDTANGGSKAFSQTPGYLYIF
jgi:hypothetical protein